MTTLDRLYVKMSETTPELFVEYMVANRLNLMRSVSAEKSTHTYLATLGRQWKYEDKDVKTEVFPYANLDGTPSPTHSVIWVRCESEKIGIKSMADNDKILSAIERTEKQAIESIINKQSQLSI